MLGTQFMVSIALEAEHECEAAFPIHTLRHSEAIMTIPTRDAKVRAPSNLLLQCSGTTSNLLWRTPSLSSLSKSSWRHIFLLSSNSFLFPFSRTSSTWHVEILGALQVSSHHHHIQPFFWAVTCSVVGHPSAEFCLQLSYSFTAGTVEAWEEFHPHAACRCFSVEIKRPQGSQKSDSTKFLTLSRPDWKMSVPK